MNTAKTLADHFPVDWLGDATIADALRPDVERMMLRMPGADAADIAAAVIASWDPELRSPPMVRDGCAKAIEMMVAELRQ